MLLQKVEGPDLKNRVEGEIAIRAMTASDESKFVNGAEFVIDNAAMIIEGKIPG